MTGTLSTTTLKHCGQSPWLDYISRDLLRSGKLRAMVEETGVLGVTSNPAIFEKAINQPGSGYEQDIRRLIRGGASTFEIYDALTIADIQAACDVLRPVYDKSDGEHGFVSLEVIPGLADDENGTVQDAVRLFKEVNRPNVMIKVPATAAGMLAVRRLIGQGVNINITLMFSRQHYRAVAQAYLDGLMDYAASGGDVGRVHSVASVFVSRIDTLIDKQLPLLAQDTADPSRKASIETLMGKAAIANSKLIYQDYKEIFSSAKFRKLQAEGAWVQKVLWGSTSCKNPKYGDLCYVENLVGQETVNTMPQATLEALLDHGDIRPNTIEEGVEHAKRVIKELQNLGFDLDAIGEQLQRQGAKLFCEAFDSLMHSIERHRMEHHKIKMPKSFEVKADRTTAQSEALLERIGDGEHTRMHERFFQKDVSLWKEDEAHQKVIRNRLGWLHSAEWMFGKLYELDQLTAQVRAEGVRDVVLLGMGGSSLAPEVLDGICHKLRAPRPRLHILDTTDPGTILDLEKKLNLHKTLFLVASKSGTTAETVSQFRYFHQRVRQKVAGRGRNAAQSLKEAGRHFVAITDEGSWLQSEAQALHFRKILVNPTDIGGRYSALSFFGLVPAALIGLPVRDILQKTVAFLNQCKTETALEKNPAFYLGLVLGDWAMEGKNKVYYWLSPGLEAFGAWVEQLVAESTGKEGKGIVPVIGTAPGVPADYGPDSAFVVIRLKGEAASGWAAKVQAVKKAGFPVVEMEWADASWIGAEFLRWEIATSIAAVVMGINPFDEPNVKESKDKTAQFLEQLKRRGRMEMPKDLISIQGRTVKINGRRASLPEYLQAFRAALKPGHYVAFLAYTPRNVVLTRAFQALQKLIQTSCKVPVLYGFGPRYLHSIGQLYKGGPRNGHFIEVLIRVTQDAPVPEAFFKFSELKMAQALGDLEALKDKGLPVLPLDLGKKPAEGLTFFRQQWQTMLKSKK